MPGIPRAGIVVALPTDLNFLNLSQAQLPYLLSGDNHSAHSMASLG